MLWPIRKEDPILLDRHHRPREIRYLIRRARANALAPIGEHREERAHLNLHRAPIPAVLGVPYQGQLLQGRGKIGRGIVRFEVGVQCVRDVVHPSGLSRSNHCCRCAVARGGLPSHEFRNARSRQKSAACVDSAGSPQISASDMRMTVRLMDR